MVESYFGYQAHINIDVADGFIRRYSITEASVHDAQAFGAVLAPDNGGDAVWAASAYRNEQVEAGLDALGHRRPIHERAYCNQPLIEAQTASNGEKAKTRAKVEHVFGDWVLTMGGKLVRAIGLERVRAQLGLKNLVSNLKRYGFWQKKTRTASQAQDG